MNDIIILSLLLEEPKHGYRLKQEAALFSQQQPLHNNTVYPLLSRFLESGWITQREAEGERGQIRLLYELTDLGQSVLIAKLNEFTEADAANANAFRLRLGLFSLLDLKERVRILELRDAHLADRLERLERIAAARPLEGWPAKTVDYVIAELKQERRWIAELAKGIEED
jgi:DNA-binding PadR family transcriptional regulator